MPREEKRPLLAVALMFAATASFVAMQAVVKAARLGGMDTTEVMFFRTAPGLPFLWLALRRRGHGLAPEEPFDVLVRSLLGTCAMGTNFVAMAWLTLAQFSTLNLAQPIFVALAAPLVLAEPTRRHIWVAMPLAAAGAIVLILPGIASRNMPAIAATSALASALFSAFAQMWVRKATASDPPDRVVFHFAAVVSVLSLAVGLARGRFHGTGSARPVEVALGEIVAMAVFGTLGQSLMTRAYAYGEAAAVSMVAYSGVALSLVVDLVVWGVLPAPSALFGAVLMVIAGFVLLRGERV